MQAPARKNYQAPAPVCRLQQEKIIRLRLRYAGSSKKKLSGSGSIILINTVWYRY
jgi:hypothetical protein